MTFDNKLDLSPRLTSITKKANIELHALKPEYKIYDYSKRPS